MKYEDLTKEQIKEARECLGRMGKCGRRVGQILVVALGALVLLLTIFDIVVSQPVMAIFPICSFISLLIVVAVAEHSPFAEFRKGYVEPEPFSEEMEQCRKENTWTELRTIGSALAATIGVIVSWCVGYEKGQLVVPIVVTVLAVWFSVWLIPKALREKKQFILRAWEIIDADKKC